MNLNLSSDRGQDRHVHAIYALLCYKKCYSWVLSTGRCDGFFVACGTGAVFLAACGATGGGTVVTVTMLLFTVNIFQACRRGGGVLIFVAFSSLVAPEVFTMKISGVAGRAGMALRWRRLRLGEQRLSFWWDYTYCYLNRYQLYSEVAILLLIPYVFHFKCVSYKYHTGFCVFTIWSRCYGFGVACGIVGGLSW